MQNVNKDSSSGSELDWTIDEEIKLFYALRSHKPVGINRHFDMVCIHDQFTKAINRDVHSKTIWKYLDTLYDMEALHENETVFFDNDEREFSLPAEYDKLKEERKKREEASESSTSKSSSKNKSLDMSIGQRKKTIKK